VLGVDSDHAGRVLSDLYAPFVRTGNAIFLMDIAAAEITKYAANAMLATRISFMNSIAQLCQATGADVDMVRRGIGSDGRIGSAFLFPGVGYGGSCFPKDVKALARTMRHEGVDSSILDAVEAVNEAQKRLLLDWVTARFGEGLKGRRFAVWGLAFKPNTDDMREAPSLVTVPGLLARGATVAAHDPVAMEEARRQLGDEVSFHSNYYDTLKGADALLIHTEWLPYRRPDFPRIKEALRNPVIMDGRNLYRPEKLEELGFEYYSVGRRAVNSHLG
jgi:UDPglucose 6-dehydrogenase